jgi:hypothetical protein
LRRSGHDFKGYIQMNELVILNSIDDAKDCIQKNLYKGRYLFTTHVSVNIYLKELYNINSTCIDTIFSEIELKENLIVFGKMVDKILLKLDNDLAPNLNQKYGLNIRYFYPLYSYLGRIHISSLFYFMEAFRIIIKKYAISKIFLYNVFLNKHIDGITDTHSILSFLYPKLKIEIVELNNNIYIKQFLKILYSILFFHRKLYSIFKNAYYNPKMLRERIGEILFKFVDGKHYDPFKKNILLHEPLYDLSFLRKKLTDSYNIFNFPRSANINQVKLKDNGSDESVPFKVDKLVKEPVTAFFTKDIQADINKHIDQYVLEAQRYQRYIDEKKNKVSLGIWGTPPVNGAKALLFEYLTAEDIPVIGTQHGGTYGDTIYPWHFSTDFNKCDYYFSWGFSIKDMKRLYPDKQPRCSVVPMGRSKQLSASNKKNGILFPLMNTYPLLPFGMSRMSPSALATRQIKLLEYLNTLKGINVTVKPMRWANFMNCGSLVVLKRLKRLHLDNTMDLISYLQKKTPRAILIELPSTSLYDCIHLDIEIFLMNDPVIPYEASVLKALRKRVHYTESAEEMVKKIDSFLDGRLETKRDNSFFNHYVYKKDAKINILKQIDKIIQN